MRSPLQKDLSLANRLIAALPAHARALFLEHSELVELKPQKALIASGQSPDHAYFPVDSLVSVMLSTADTPGVQVALVGNEGMFNTSLVLGVDSRAFTSLVQREGRAFCIHRSALQLRINEDSRLRDILNRYVDVCHLHLAQQIACIQHHTVEQRLARCLLMNCDRTHSSELFLTHKVLALMLGVRRESVTRAASTFEARGLISYSPGYLMLLDEAGLGKVSCRCYLADRLTYERALGGLLPLEPWRPDALTASLPGN